MEGVCFLQGSGINAARIAVLGAGNMGTVLAEGIIRNGGLAREVRVTGRSQAENLERLRSMGAQIEESNRTAAEKSDVIILCVKPKDMAGLLEELGGACRGKLVISIAAGVGISAIAKRLEGARVARTMLNICVEAGKSATAVCYGPGVKKSEQNSVERIFGSFGMMVRATQGQMAAFTALAGCVPAALFGLMGRLSEFAEQRGFSRDDARRLAAQVFEGSADMFRRSSKSSEELVRSVMSKRGATEKMFECLLTGKFFEMFLASLLAAEERTEELGRETGSLMEK